MLMLRVITATVLLAVLCIAIAMGPLAFAGVMAVAFGAALPFDATHGVATVVFLAALYVPWRKKLERIKRKYALI